MDVTFSSIKWQGSTPSINRFMLWFWGGIALPFYRQSICFHFMETFWGGQALSFYRPWLLPTRMRHPLCHFRSWFFVAAHWSRSHSDADEIKRIFLGVKKHVWCLCETPLCGSLEVKKGSDSNARTIQNISIINNIYIYRYISMCNRYMNI